MVPRSGVRRPFDALHRGGLAGAVGPDQTEDLAVVDLERHVVDGHRPAVGLADAGDLNDWMWRRSLCRCHREAITSRCAGVLSSGRPAFGIPLRQYERVTSIERAADGFLVRSVLRGGGERHARAKAVVVATGYFGSPNYLGVPGEDSAPCRACLSRRARGVRPGRSRRGGGNSAAEAALDLWRSGARVTLVHFGPDIRQEDQAVGVARLRESNERRKHCGAME